MRRALEVARLAYGGLLLIAPERVIGWVTGDTGNTEVTRTVVRVLGARHVAQGAATLLTTARSAHGARWHRLGAGADLLHFASLPVLALFADPAQRRLLACDAPVELLFAIAELTCPAPAG